MSTFKADDGYGRIRTFTKKSCEICKEEFAVRLDRIDRRRFCSPKCAHEGQRNSEQMKCELCSLVFQRPKNRIDGRRVFCSRSCKDKAQSFEGLTDFKPLHYVDGAASYRERALRHYGLTCNRCDYNEDDRMLDVHHIDGKRSNNCIENLEVICVWCHALETRKNWKSFKDKRA